MSKGPHATMQEALACSERQGKTWVKHVHTADEQRAASEFMFRGFTQEQLDSFSLGVVEALVEWKLIAVDLDQAHHHIWAGGGSEASDHVRTLLRAEERMRRIAEAHHKNVDAQGGTWGECNECNWIWPCPTYRWATSDELDAATDPWRPYEEDA